MLDAVITCNYSKKRFFLRLLMLSGAMADQDYHANYWYQVHQKTHYIIHGGRVCLAKGKRKPDEAGVLAAAGRTDVLDK